MSKLDPDNDEFMCGKGGVIFQPQPATSPDMVIGKITITKHSLVADPAIEADPEAAEYINDMIRRAEGSWFSNIFDRMFETLFEACPSPHAEDYRRRSVDITRACVS